MKRGRPLSGMTFLMLLRRMGRDGLTAHGFRSTFRDWAAERGFPDEVCELALAHAVSDKVLAAEREIMDPWFDENGYPRRGELWFRRRASPFLSGAGLLL